MASLPTNPPISPEPDPKPAPGVTYVVHALLDAQNLDLAKRFAFRCTWCGALLTMRVSEREVCPVGTLMATAGLLDVRILETYELHNSRQAHQHL